MRKDQRGRIFILSGPSGAGKTTLFEAALKNVTLKKHFAKVVSVTTRAPRKGERHRRDYFFVSDRLFAYKKRAGHFLEWEKVFDYYYATPKGAVLDLLKKGKNVLLCIDVKGAKTIVRSCPDAVKVFIKTSSIKVLKARLEKRGTEKDKSFRLRVQAAKEEVKEASKYDYVIVNDRLPAAVKTLEEILTKESKRKEEK